MRAAILWAIVQTLPHRSFLWWEGTSGTETDDYYCISMATIKWQAIRLAHAHTWQWNISRQFIRTVQTGARNMKSWSLNTTTTTTPEEKHGSICFTITRSQTPNSDSSKLLPGHIGQPLLVAVVVCSRTLIERAPRPTRRFTQSAPRGRAAGSWCPSRYQLSRGRHGFQRIRLLRFLSPISYKAPHNHLHRTTSILLSSPTLNQIQAIIQNPSGHRKRKDIHRLHLNLQY